MKTTVLSIASFAAAIAFPAAHAEPAAVASINYAQLQFRVIDLNPNDGVAAAFNLTQSSSSVDLKVWNGSYDLVSSHAAQFDAIAHPAQTLSYEGKELLVAATETDATISAVVPTWQSPRGSAAASSASTWEFTLTPNTVLIFTGDAHLAVGTDPERPFLLDGMAELRGYGNLAGSANAVASFTYGRDTDWLLDGTLQQGFGFALTNNSDYVVPGSITLEAATRAIYWTVPQTPEPATYLMLGSGLVLAAVAARRRRA
jgi:hypothetical protein